MSTWQSRRTLGALAVPAVLSLLSALPGLTPAASAQPLTGAGTVTGDLSDSAPRPNIVFVMADDLGWSDLGTGRTNLGNGNDFNETPAIDRLADEGQTFDNAYACLNCAPDPGGAADRPLRPPAAEQHLRGRRPQPRG